jgi:hypothetical protein
MNYLMLGAVLLLAIFSCAWLAYRKRGEVLNMANAANSPNAGVHGDGYVTYLADAAITRYHLVKTGSDENHVAVSAGATDKIIGIAQDQADLLGDPISIAVLGAVKGTQRVIATGVIAVDAFVQSNGDGTVKTAVSTGYVVGKALKASGATGDVIEITPCLAFAPLA